MYKDGDIWFFTNNEKFERYAVDKQAVSSVSPRLVEGMECVITFWNEQSVKVVPGN
jgi:translation elongation factor P/translation initiation factor 5A